jgi:hydrogenase nickel incorporation protein HypB
MDKPLKYPVMFKNADLVVLTKTDLLPYLPDISAAAILENLARVMPVPRMIQLAATRDQGLDEWLDWLEGQRRQVIAQAPAKPNAELLRRASRGLRPLG